jgi:hypothetical protein
VPILVHRLRLIADSMKKPSKPELVDNFHCGRLMLKPRISRTFWDEADIHLTRTEFKIVHLLASNVGSYVTYRAVFDCTNTSVSSRGAATMATERMSALASSKSETSSAPSTSLTLKLSLRRSLRRAAGRAVRPVRKRRPADAGSRDPSLPEPQQPHRRCADPTLEDVDPGKGQVALNADLAKYSSDGTILKLMVQPVAATDGAGIAKQFYFVASAPQIRADEVSAELDELSHRGILQRLSDVCIWDTTNEIRYKRPDGTFEL